MSWGLKILWKCLLSHHTYVAGDSEADQRPQLMVSTLKSLEELLDHCESATRVALDTEFVGFPSLVPKLQLVQV